MCEYCGCQSPESVAQLTREHDTVVDLIGALRSAHRDGTDGLTPHPVVPRRPAPPPARRGPSVVGQAVGSGRSRTACSPGRPVESPPPRRSIPAHGAP